MREYILKELRERACVRGKQRTWVSDLTDEQLYELFLRLRNGESAKSIARYVQQAWEVGPRSTPHSVSQGVLKFKKRIAHLLLTPTVERSIPSVSNDSSASDFPEDLEGLEHIAQLQSERIRQMMAEERGSGVRHANMSREVQALTALNKTILKAKDWQLAHEGLDPAKRRTWEQRKRKIEVQFQSVMDSLGDDGRHRLVRALERFLDLAEREAVELKLGPDGEYRISRPD